VWRTSRLAASALTIGVALGVIGSPFAGAQQPTLKRTDLLKLDLGEIKDDSEMNVWVADIAAGAATGRHTHPTPRCRTRFIICETRAGPTQPRRWAFNMPEKVSRFRPTPPDARR
jgi:hypothetical protein